MQRAGTGECTVHPCLVAVLELDFCAVRDNARRVCPNLDKSLHERLFVCLACALCVLAEAEGQPDCITIKSSFNFRQTILCRINNHICFFFVHKLIFLQNQIHYQRKRVTIAKSSFLIFTIFNTVVIIHIHAEFYRGIWFSVAQEAHSLNCITTFPQNLTLTIPSTNII